MKLSSSRSPGAGISRGMWIALAATLALTATSYGVRSWREATHAASVEEMAAAADAAPASPPAVNLATVPASPPPTNPTPVSAPPVLAAAPARALVAAAPAGLRPSVPGPAADAMASRHAVPPPPHSATPNEAPPPVAALPAPSFRLIGRYLDGAKSVAFLTHDDSVIAAKAGDSLPDGFKLKSIRPSGIVVLRRANQEKIEMLLPTP